MDRPNEQNQSIISIFFLLPIGPQSKDLNSPQELEKLMSNWTHSHHQASAYPLFGSGKKESSYRICGAGACFSLQPTVPSQSLKQIELHKIYNEPFQLDSYSFEYFLSGFQYTQAPLKLALLVLLSSHKFVQCFPMIFNSLLNVIMLSFR